MTAAGLGWGTDAVDGVRRTIRVTASLSLLVFLLTYTASALAVLAPSRRTGWLRRNRRWLGLSFALSHAVHGGAVVAFAWLDPVEFQARMTPAALAMGGFGYVVIVAMVSTASDRVAARIGAGRRAMLHGAGAHYLWAVFFLTYGKRALLDPVQGIPLALLGLALALQILAKRRRAAPA